MIYLSNDGELFLIVIRLPLEYLFLSLSLSLEEAREKESTRVSERETLRRTKASCAG